MTTMPTRIAWLSIIALETACSPATDSNPRRAAPAEAAGLQSDDAFAGSDGALTPPSTQNPSLLPPVESEPTTALPGCGGGKYSGMYDAPFWGTGPINFELSQADSQASNCGEFCPDFTITDGGSFVLSWAVFEGGAMLTGGLDCSSGEFRAELVDGNVHLVGGSDKDALFQLSGTLQGQFMANPARIVGSFMLASALDASGTFTVMQ